jgi:hypothetical protein
MPRQLTSEQEAFVAQFGTEEYRANARKNQEDYERALAERTAEIDRQIAESRAEAAKEDAKVKLVEDALRAAGIKLDVGACGCCSSPWVKAQLPDGTMVEFDGRGLDTFDDE